MMAPVALALQRQLRLAGLPDATTPRETAFKARHILIGLVPAILCTSLCALLPVAALLPVGSPPLGQYVPPDWTHKNSVYLQL